MILEKTNPIPGNNYSNNLGKGLGIALCLGLNSF
jgi:hypothetical protein